MGSHHDPRGVFVDPTTAPYVDAAVIEVTKIIDGDSQYILREFDPLVTDDQIIIARDRRPKHTRLVVVNTPEHKDPVGWGRARQDAILWLGVHKLNLRARTYGEDDFGRILVDLYDHTTGESLSAFLISQGWPPFVPKETHS